jgi:predicted DNA-binding ribbon-helix-helix protein
MSLGKFVTKLHDEVLELHGEVHNFASLLRCSCLIYLSDAKAAQNCTDRHSVHYLEAAE